MMSQHVDAIDLSIEAAIAAATSRSLDIEVLQNPKSNNDLTYNLIEASTLYYRQLVLVLG